MIESAHLIILAETTDDINQIDRFILNAAEGCKQTIDFVYC